MSSKWKKLSLSRQDETPALLYKYTQTAKGYEVFITDLTHIWSEQLDHRDVLKRADQDGTTIDPSEDSDQFKVLLQKVGEALQGFPGSSRTLNTGPSNDSLELLVSTKLPAPLKPLKWTLDLSKQLSSSTTTHLMLPLLQEEADWQVRQRSLLDQLKQKDWVLGKLFDKIEAIGLDLSTVFPGVSGLRTARKGSSLSQAARHIKGVTPFDEQTWLKEGKRSTPDQGLAANILTEIIGPDSSNQDMENVSSAPENWWEKLSERPTSTITLEREESRGRPAPKTSGTDLAMDTDTAPETEDDEFERQETPPRLKQSKAAEEEEKHESPSKPSPSLSPPPKAKSKPSKGLGVIGGKKATKKASPKPAPSPPPEPEHIASPEPPKKTTTRDDLETDSGSDDDNDEDDLDQSPPPRPAPKEPSPPPVTQPKKPRGLGTIGGKKKEKTPTPTPTPPQPPSPSPPVSENPSPPPKPEPKPKRAGKLGVIGGRKPQPPKSDPPRAEPTSKDTAKEEGKEGEATDSGDESIARPTPKTASAPAKSPSPVKRPKSPPPEPEKEETEQERADRKREELKRQLEAKSKAPAKKKRRF